MATKQNITKIFDGLVELADCYEAFALIAMNEESDSTKTWVLLNNLNHQFREIVDEMDSWGLLS